MWIEIIYDTEKLIPKIVEAYTALWIEINTYVNTEHYRLSRGLYSLVD